MKEEVLVEIISSLENGIAPGSSGIGATHLKYLISINRFSGMVTRLMNTLLDKPKLV